MRTEDFNYILPEAMIAQTPVEPRHNARLMVLDRPSGLISHRHFYELGEFLNPGDLLVINQTRVIPARLFALKVPTGGHVEILLLRKQDLNTWACLVGGKGLFEGKELQVIGGPAAKIAAVLEGSERLISFAEPIELYFHTAGHVPLPPYIHAQLEDPERYQTIYNKIPGSAAAPTAGLHFTPVLMDALKAKGIDFVELTLHVGLDTFAPVHESDPTKHNIHKEWCELSQETANRINQVKSAGKRVIAVGTTSVRTLEAAARASNSGQLSSFRDETNLYILPGFDFKIVDVMITNFHLPKSTLLMLVSAFAGRETILSAYETAKLEGYRFFSFGDAMLIQ